MNIFIKQLKLVWINQSGYIPVDEVKWETASEAVHNMHVGWNLGNTLDVHGEWIELYTERKPSDYETGWGQPITLFRAKENLSLIIQLAVCYAG